MDTFQGTTHIMFVLDRSDSMTTLQDEAISGFNAWKSSVLETPGDYSLTLTLFNTNFDTPVANTPLQSVADLTRALYHPNGMTALNDAIVASIRKVEPFVKPEDRALVVILTDGQENSSKEFAVHNGGTSKVRAIIESYEARGNWTFTYLSASLSAFADSQSYGIKVGNTMQFEPTSYGTQAALQSLGQSTGLYSRSVASASSGFYSDVDEDTDRPSTTWAKSAFVGSPKTAETKANPWLRNN